MTPILTYYDLGDRITAFSTTREGGYSTGSYGEMNINAYCGDQPEHIRMNRNLLCRELGLSTPDDIFMPHQVHDTLTWLIGKAFLESSAQIQSEALDGVDALMTDQRNICIGVSTADCTPIIVYDPDHHVAAVIHAGWRGTVARIAEHAVGQMFGVFRSEPSRLKAVIGPCISVGNFEVGDEVYEAFREQQFPMEQIAVRQGKWHINLPLCNRLQLQGLGIPAGNIQDSGICTFDRPDLYFSARRLGILSGRIFTGVVLR